MKTIAHYLIILALCLSHSLSVQCSSVSKKSLDLATKDLDAFLSKAKKADIQHLRNYVTYYRSEGHYQAVTPAPQHIRDALSKEAKALFEKFTEYAKPLTKKRRPIPGSSSLTQEGEEYYESLLTILNKAASE